jgi:glycosyltransferase involved in cell wall biosynthesis
LKKKYIYYWSPFLTKIATIKAVLSSAESLVKYSNEFQPTIINAAGEFDEYIYNLNNKNISVINLSKKNYIKNLPRFGFFNSRISFIIIFFRSFFSLKKLIAKDNPDFLIMHLISSLPIILMLIFKFETKFILRISGYPKLNLFRKFFWKIAFKRIYKVTCPTQKTLDLLLKDNIVSSDKIFLVPDPILDLNLKKKVDVKFLESNFNLAAGRLTQQKNFIFLIEAFYEVLKIYPNEKLIIAGDGEQKQILIKKIQEMNVAKNIILIGYKDNIYEYMKQCNSFILSSLFEDPGFVLIEAIFNRAFIISSNCETAPMEIIGQHSDCGLIYQNNNIESFKNAFIKFKNFNKDEIKLKKIKAFKKIKKYTIFQHFKLIKSVFV